MIKIGQKWIALCDTDILGETNEVIHQFHIGDIITITNIDNNEVYPYYTDIEDYLPLNKPEIINNFITLAEWRDKQINSILDD